MITIQTAIEELGRLRRPTIAEATTRLSNIRVVLSLAEAYKVLDENTLGGVQLPSAKIKNLAATREAMVKELCPAIGKLFPIDDMMTEETYEHDGAYIPHVVLEPQTFGFGYDDFEQISQGTSGFDSFNTFLIMMMYYHFDEADWDVNVARFHWNTPPPISLYGGYQLDWDKFAIELQKNGLLPFYAAFELITFCTGNIFLDTNVLDESGDYGAMYVPLTPENIVGLTRAWRQAQEIWHVVGIAERIVEQDRRLYRVIVEIWNRCLIDHIWRRNQQGVIQ